MVIGRLNDELTKGLLHLTKCGKTSKLICITRVEKEYLAQVDGITMKKALGDENIDAVSKKVHNDLAAVRRVHHQLDNLLIIPPPR
jgi:16S rRNA U516 pseudouridylate synthase RsuA-like enzyme